jgi:hypothetical protein
MGLEAMVTGAFPTGKHGRLKVVDIVVDSGVETELGGAKFGDPLVGRLACFAAVESEER